MSRLILIAILFLLELVYLFLAKKFNIIDKPNPRSSHKRNVLRGGGIIFLFAVWIYAITGTTNYNIFVVGMTLISIVAFADDIHSLSPIIRFVVQFIAMALLLCEVGMIDFDTKMYLFVIPSLILGVCIINAYNFMDGINGMTGINSLMTLVTFWLLNREMAFIDASIIEVMIMSTIVFCFFNFRNKAICFAGDVGSVGIAYCIIFIMLKLILYTKDITNLILLSVYGVDVLLTIIHRLMLHENILKPHRKMLFQLLANEGGIPHVVVSTAYMLIQLIISLAYIYIPINKWTYVIVILIILCLAYLLIEQKLYPLHRKYLEQIKQNNSN